jgi:hypothetical protein
MGYSLWYHRATGWTKIIKIYQSRLNQPVWCVIVIVCYFVHFQWRAPGPAVWAQAHDFQTWEARWVRPGLFTRGRRSVWLRTKSAWEQQKIMECWYHFFRQYMCVIVLWNVFDYVELTVVHTKIPIVSYWFLLYNYRCFVAFSVISYHVSDGTSSVDGFGLYHLRKLLVCYHVHISCWVVGYLSLPAFESFECPLFHS